MSKKEDSKRGYCEHCGSRLRRRKTKKAEEVIQPKTWKDQFYEVEPIGPEPAFNKEGYWKEHKQEEPEIKEYEPKK